MDRLLGQHRCAAVDQSRKVGARVINQRLALALAQSLRLGLNRRRPRRLALTDYPIATTRDEGDGEGSEETHVAVLGRDDYGN